MNRIRALPEPDAYRSLMRGRRAALGLPPRADDGCDTVAQILRAAIRAGEFVRDPR